MKICPVGAKLISADGQMGRHGRTNSRFSEFCERASKLVTTSQLRKTNIKHCEIKSLIDLEVGLSTME